MLSAYGELLLTNHPEQNTFQAGGVMKKYQSISGVVTAVLLFSAVQMVAMKPGSAHAENSSSDAEIAVTRVGDEVDVSWKVSSEYSQVQLLQDGVEVGTGAPSDSETITDVDQTGHNYEIVATRALTDDEFQAALADSSIEFSSSSDLEAVSILGVTLGPTLDFGITEAASATAAATSTTVRYQTFIPSLYVAAPPVGCSYSGLYDNYFKGDNRSYSVSSTSYRTRFDTLINWAALSITSTRSVGTTHVYLLYNSAYSLVASATAPSSSMVLTPTSITSTIAKFQMKQDVANPFCSSNGIYFNLAFTVNKAGGYYITGQRLQVPSHEIYIKDSDVSTWKTVLQDPALDFVACLTPGYSGVAGCLENTTLTGTR